MKKLPSFTPAEWQRLLADHQQLIHLANDLEFHLYQLGGVPAPEHITACQQAAGTLIGKLRETLFRHDQQVFPILETLVQANDSGVKS